MNEQTDTKPMEAPHSAPSTDADRCGAETRDGTPCQKHPAQGAARCRFHGGASTGPHDPSALKGNDHAAGNPGGGAPKRNANAEIHGGFADWRKAYDRLGGDRRAYVDRLAADMRETAAEHAPDIPGEKRERLCLEKATLMMLERRARFDLWCDPDGSGPGRGLLVEKEIERAGETVTVERLNPASRARVSLSRRQRAIAEKLRLWPGFQDEDGENDHERTGDEYAERTG